MHGRLMKFYRIKGIKIKRKCKSAERCVDHHALASKTLSGATLSLLGPSFQLPGTGHSQEQESGPGVTLRVLSSSVRTTSPGKKT